MTATLDVVTSKGKDKLEPATEQKVAEELVARAREQGASLTGPAPAVLADWLFLG